MQDKNYNHWNVCLWLFNDEGLYNLMRDALRHSCNKGEAVTRLMRELPDQTPDGVPYTRTAVRAALRGE